MFCLVALLASSCSRRSEDIVVFAGSSTIGPIFQGLEPFYAKHGIKIQVQGGGSSVGVKSARERLALFGMASRELSAQEKAELAHVTIARDGVAIIVHSSNPLSDVNSELIREIYGGKRSQWDGGQPITVINKEAGRATLEVFEEHFGLKGSIRKDAVIIGPNGQAVASVARDPNAIAYVSIADAKAAHDNGTAIKLLALDGMAPTAENVSSGAYKLSRPLNVVYLPENKEKAESLLKLLATPEARAEMMRLSFVPAL
jgi:phosphate transport system substrate-binding protein